MKEALYYKKLDLQKVQCFLCPHHCVIAPDKSGLCMVRRNLEGILYATEYSKTIAVNNDPIEKKPLYHFHPGKMLLSIGPNGCNFACNNCQNWEISQKPAPTQTLTPEQAVAVTKRAGSIGISYTYTEPLVWFEYVLDTAKLARQEGLVNVLVSNGYIEPEPYEELLPWIDAVNIDVKSMREDFYKEIVHGTLAPVLKTCQLSYGRIHLEVTNLVIPTLNDSPEDFNLLADWIHDTLGPDVPLHFSRYFPAYKATQPPTPPGTLMKARDLAMKKLHYVYVGNIWGMDYNSTICPSCKKKVIVRDGYTVSKIEVKGGKCIHCGGEVKVVGV
jgi:pyruvate formate lyase activating enzyme